MPALPSVAFGVGGPAALPAWVGQGLACPERSRRAPCRLVILSGAKDLLVLFTPFTLNESEGSEAEGSETEGLPPLPALQDCLEEVLRTRF